MRSIRAVATAAVLSLAAASTASAQVGRPFRDSWFWGIRTGAETYSGSNLTNPTIPGSSSFAPIVGADWLITRTHGGLYVAYSQAFLSTKGVILNGPTSADSGYLAVDVSGLRRVDVIAMTFPGDYIKWHPYIGFGVSFRYLGDAEAEGPFPSSKQADYAAGAVNDAKASLGPALVAGAQYRLKWISVFGQANVSAVSKDFLLANGHTVSLSTEFGLRYNIGSSIDR